jgi:hypothetical protein
MPSMNLELSDEQAALLERELRRIIDDDCGGSGFLDSGIS